MKPSMRPELPPAGTVETGSRAIWPLATAIALGAHLGLGALAMMQSEAPDLEDQPAGSIVLELAPVVTASANASAALALGPESVDSVASQPQSTAKLPEPAQTEVPVAQPSPSEPEPDLAVPVPVVEGKPVEHRDPDVRRPEAQSESAAELSVASQTMAPPKIEAAAVGPKSAAPETGVSPGAARAKLTWHQAIVVHLNRFKRFPADAAITVTKGEVVVQFAIERSGRVLSSSVVQSSGSAVLDAEAIAMLQRAAPLPRPSPDVLGESFTLTVPVVFRQR